jgi:hypothetical protein
LNVWCGVAACNAVFIVLLSPKIYFRQRLPGTSKIRASMPGGHSGLLFANLQQQRRTYQHQYYQGCKTGAL